MSTGCEATCVATTSGTSTVPSGPPTVAVTFQMPSSDRFTPEAPKRPEPLGVRSSVDWPTPDREASWKRSSMLVASIGSPVS